jgi:hypothetical protein
MTRETSHCSCWRYEAFSANDYETEYPRLVLTKPGAVSGCERYLAISYCYQQPTAQAQGDECGPCLPRSYTIHASGSTRRNRVPPLVVYRSTVYAAKYGYFFIWIDQYIGQDDLAEKAEAIDQMHRFYWCSSQVVAILNRTSTEQGHPNAIGTSITSDV